MARFKGLIQFIGTLGGITAVNSKEGIYLKSKNAIPKSRYKKAPEYADFRMNGHYMGVSAKLSSAFRHPILLFGKDASDPRMYSRMNALMRGIIMCDTVSRKGAFDAAIGISTAEGKQLLLDFEFNKFVSFTSIFRGQYALDIASGLLTMPAFAPKNALVLPVGSTHVGLQSGMLRFDFASHKGVFNESNRFVLPIDGLADVALDCAIPSGSGGTLVCFFKVVFMQEVNGDLYPLKGDGGAVMKVVGVE